MNTKNISLVLGVVLILAVLAVSAFARSAVSSELLIGAFGVGCFLVGFQMKPPGGGSAPVGAVALLLVALPSVGLLSCAAFGEATREERAQQIAGGLRDGCKYWPTVRLFVPANERPEIDAACSLINGDKPDTIEAAPAPVDARGGGTQGGGGNAGAAGGGAGGSGGQ